MRNILRFWHEAAIMMAGLLAFAAAFALFVVVMIKIGL
jgi:hypothetical protein